MLIRRLWLVLGIAGFFAGLALFLFAFDSGVAHLGIIVAIAAPILAFYRLMKPAIGARHCPTRPDWTAR